MECLCESRNCDHSETWCKREAVETIATIYGRYEMCSTCIANMPSKYLKGNAGCQHEFVEGVDEDGKLVEPPFDICIHCGEIRY